MIIRKEIESDIEAITEVTIAAFKNCQYGNHTEQFIIHALRAAEALTVSLVADVEGIVVGHITFSPVTISDSSQNWYGLGPFSVLPEYQKQGIGTNLLNHVKQITKTKRLLVGTWKDAGWAIQFYQKHGFKLMPDKDKLLRKYWDIPQRQIETSVVLGIET